MGHRSHGFSLDEEVEDADKRLVVFTREIGPVLNEYLPK
jgi:hypothetical protein